MAKKYEPTRSWIPFNLSSKPMLNECKRKNRNGKDGGGLSLLLDELHGKLVYAEALLTRALVTFIQDQGLLSFISGALKIKECHDVFV